MDTMILNDKTIINLKAGADLANLVTLCTDTIAAGLLLSKLTKDNLSSVQLKNEAGFSNGTYSDMVLMPGNYEITDDGVIVTIKIREMTEVEKKLAELEVSQAVQNAAIDDLANTVSEA